MAEQRSLRQAKHEPHLKLQTWVCCCVCCCCVCVLLLCVVIKLFSCLAHSTKNIFCRHLLSTLKAIKWAEVKRKWCCYSWLGRSRREVGLVQLQKSENEKELTASAQH